MLVNGGLLLVSLWLAPLFVPGAALPAAGIGLALLILASVRSVAPGHAPSFSGLVRSFLPAQLAVALVCLAAGRLIWAWPWKAYLFLPIWIGLSMLAHLGFLPWSKLRPVILPLIGAFRAALHFCAARIARGDDTAVSGAILVGLAGFLAGRLNPSLGLGWTGVVAPALLWLAADIIPLARWQSAPDCRRRLMRYGARLGVWTVLAGAFLLATGDGHLRARIVVLILTTLTLAGFGLSHRHRLVGGSENAARMLLALLAWVLILPFAGHQLLGSQDAVWYHNTLADFLAQVHAGVFPVFVGQSEHLFNGGVLPVRFAPLFQHYGLLLDTLTLRSFSPAALQQGVIIGSLLGAALSAYAVLARLLPGRPWFAAGLSALFLTCPGVLAVIYYEDLLMTWTTLPWLPLVFGGCALSFRSASPRPLLLVGCALGIVWWGHAPVAMWSTLAVALLQLARLAETPVRDWPWRQVLAAATCFFAIALHPLVSVLAVPVQADSASMEYTPTNPDDITHFISQCFPQILVPLFLKSRWLSDFQPGWPLLLLLGGGLAVLLRQRIRDARSWSLLAVPLGLQLCVMPVPGLTGVFWSVVPDFLVNPTGTWPMQRFYVIIAISTVCLAAVLVERVAPRRLPLWLACTLTAGVLWSILSVIPLLRSKNLQRREIVLAADRLRPENFVLTRYAYLVFGRQPAYYTHGHMDALLEQRFLDADSRRWIGGNPNAILQDPAVGRVLGEGSLQAAVRKAGEPWQITPRFRLEPGKRYALELRFTHPEVPGVLLLNGPGFSRVYALPSHGEKLSFGSGPESSPLLSLFTTHGTAIELALAFAPQAGPDTVDLSHFGTYRWLEVDTGNLPIRVTGWIPFHAEVNAPAAGWLETPRMFQPGYQAVVNGKSVTPLKSPEGLVAVPVPAGHSEVTLAYKAPVLLRLSYWTSLVAIILGSGLLLVALLRSPAPGAHPQ